MSVSWFTILLIVLGSVLIVGWTRERCGSDRSQMLVKLLLAAGVVWVVFHYVPAFRSTGRPFNPHVPGWVIVAGLGVLAWMALKRNREQVSSSQENRKEQPVVLRAIPEVERVVPTVKPPQRRSRVNPVISLVVMASLVAGVTLTLISLSKKGVTSSSPATVATKAQPPRRKVEPPAIAQPAPDAAISVAQATNNDAEIARTVGQLRARNKSLPSNQWPRSPEPNFAPLRGRNNVRWTVESRHPWHRLEENAFADARDVAHEQVARHIHRIYPASDWEPSRAEIERLVKNRTPIPQKLDEPIVGGPSDSPIEEVYGARLELELPHSTYEEMMRVARLDQAHDRQWLAIKALLGILAVLGTAAAYFRLEDLTKGYYTGWLRAGVGILIGAGILLLIGMIP